VICFTEAEPPTSEVAGMFDIYCPSCDLTFLVWTRSLVALHNSSDGPIGLVRCPAGHFNVVRFHEPRRPVADDLEGGERGVGPKRDHADATAA
jgi:hypothetical protein